MGPVHSLFYFIFVFGSYCYNNNTSFLFHLTSQCPDKQQHRLFEIYLRQVLELSLPALLALIFHSQIYSDPLLIPIHRLHGCCCQSHQMRQHEVLLQLDACVPNQLPFEVTSTSALLYYFQNSQNCHMVVLLFSL
jgi:hypothetical protein